MSERSQRASQRGSWPGSLTTLAEQADAAIVRGGTPGERVAMVWRVTLDAWASSGRPLPSYTRAEMPGRVLRSGHGYEVRLAIEGHHARLRAGGLLRR